MTHLFNVSSLTTSSFGRFWASLFAFAKKIRLFYLFGFTFSLLPIELKSSSMEWRKPNFNVVDVAATSIFMSAKTIKCTSYARNVRFAFKQNALVRCGKKKTKLWPESNTKNEATTTANRDAVFEWERCLRMQSGVKFTKFHHHLHHSMSSNSHKNKQTNKQKIVQYWLRWWLFQMLQLDWSVYA